MNPEHLHALLAVSETNSISAAARSIGVDRATVNRRLRELSEHLGQPLLQGRTVGSGLTPAASFLVEQAPAILRSAEALDAELRRPAVALGHYRVAVPVGLAEPVLTLLMRIAHRALPDSRFDMLFTEEPLVELAGRADLGFAFGPGVPEGPWRTATVVRLPERLVASRAYLDAHGTPQSIDDLAQHTLLLWSRDRAMEHVLPLADGTTVPVDPWMTTTHSWVAWRAVEQGLGIGLIPWGPLPKRETPPPELVHVLPGEVHRDRTVQVILPYGRLPLPRARSLVGLVRAMFAEMTR